MADTRTVQQLKRYARGHPYDLTARLALADALDEEGGGGDFQRLLVSLARSIDPRAGIRESKATFAVRSPPRFMADGTTYCVVRKRDGAVFSDHHMSPRDPRRFTLGEPAEAEPPSDCDASPGGPHDWRGQWIGGHPCPHEICAWCGRRRPKPS